MGKRSWSRIYCGDGLRRDLAWRKGEGAVSWSGVTTVGSIVCAMILKREFGLYGRNLKKSLG
jgi:hypothetical protein